MRIDVIPRRATCSGGANDQPAKQTPNAFRAVLDRPPPAKLGDRHPWRDVACVGDSTTEDNIRTIDFQPRFFGAENDRFAFWFGLDSEWPRGQLNAGLMLTECGSPGAWWRVFNEPNLLVYDEPTLCGVDYPNIGIRRAQNDMTRGNLEIETMAATPSRRGDLTSFTIDHLPNPADVSVTVDNIDYTRWRVSGADSIQIEMDINDHQIRVAFGGAQGRGGAERMSF